MTTAPHLSAAEIAGFIDSTLASDARAAAELHFSNCPLCRGELASCLRLAGTLPARPPRRISLPLAAAAAGVVLAAALLPFARRVSQPAPLERGAAAVHAETMTPANGSVIPSRGIRLAWQRDSAAVSYHVVVTDSVGTPVWSADLSDTSVVPLTLPLAPGARGFWRVDVLHADGSSTQSRTAAFRIAP